MTARTTSAGSGRWSEMSLARFGGPVSLAFFGVLPLLVICFVFADLWHQSSAGLDFRQFYDAAHAIRHGHDPYGVAVSTPWGGPYPYPPLPALLAVPMTVLPVQVASLVVLAALVGVALAVPYVLGVRDWRCYGVLFLWPPTIQAIQTGNVTLWFALAAALTWRYRDRVLSAATLIGISLAVKFFLWPLAVWLAATRRFAAAALSLILGAALLVLSWALIGFDGFLDYPDVLRKLERAVGSDSYTTYVLGVELGLPSEVSRALWLLLGLSVLAALVIVARSGDDRSAFILGIAAALSLTPIVWIHYFALLVVVVALARPRLGLVWFVPLGFLVAPGSGHHSVVQLGAGVVVAAVTFVVALRCVAVDRRERSLVPELVPA